jgi:hypothetical protein
MLSQQHVKKFMTRVRVIFRRWLKRDTMALRAKIYQIRPTVELEKDHLPPRSGTFFLRVQALRESREQAELAWKQEISEGETVVPIRPTRRHYPEDLRRFVQDI